MVTVYSAVWCGYCHAVKNYFDSLGVKYEDLDIESDPVNMHASIEKSGQMGIPVVDIDGTIIVGFNKPMIDAALKDKHLIS
jgi:glutaredoxin 3